MSGGFLALPWPLTLQMAVPQMLRTGRCLEFLLPYFLSNSLLMLLGNRQKMVQAPGPREGAWLLVSE